MLDTHVMTWHSVGVAYESLAGARPGEAEAYFAESARAARALGLDAMSITSCGSGLPRWGTTRL